MTSNNNNNNDNNNDRRTRRLITEEFRRFIDRLRRRYVHPATLNHFLSALRRHELEKLRWDLGSEPGAVEP